MMDNEIVIVGRWYQNNFKIFIEETIFMKNIKRFKKYFYGMSFNPPPPCPQLTPNCYQQNYIIILWKTRVLWKKKIIKKNHYHLW